MKAFLPQNLNLTNQLEFTPPTFDFHPDNFKYICSLISEIPAYTKGVCDDSDYVSVNATKLQGRVHEYRKYIDYLIDNNILECDYHYIKGEKSLGYRFVEEFRTPVATVDLHKTSLQKKARVVSKYNFQMQDKYDYLYKWFNPDLQIDFSGSLDYLRQQYAVDNTDVKVKNPTRKFNSSFVSLHRLVNQDYYFSIDSTAGRCHTNLTSIKSELRNFITYDGQQLVSIDIKNAQPCFSGLLLNPEFYRACSKRTKNNELLSLFGDKIASKSEVEAKILQSILSSLSSHMLEDLNQNIDNQLFNKYLEIIQDGTFYEFIAVKGNLPLDDRKKLKAVVFTALFTDNRFIGQKDAESKRLFKEMFPAVYDVFALIKKHDSTLLSKFLQRIEAKIILDHVAKRISIEKPELPLFTIHDSLVVPRGYELYASEILKQEMFIKTGMNPSVKHEFWSPDSVNTKSSLKLKMAA